MTKKSWSGRFAGDENPLMETFNASIQFDHVLYKEDLQGSRAHVSMLAKVGLLTPDESREIILGLDFVEHEIETGSFEFKPEYEDIHMAIESRLQEHIGAVAGKLHTARSRNDQVALDLKLYVRHVTTRVLHLMKSLSLAFLKLAEKNPDVILPGYTHMQRAQPVLLARHLMAYSEMLRRDQGRLTDNLNRLKECPLGAGAIAGTTLPIDRAFTARELGFESPSANSMDTVSDRDFVIDFISASATLMMHLSRLAEEWILWNTQEFSFINLPEEFCTGSSMMPQKVNPDALELIRGKTGRVYGHLMALFTTMKALPLTYNKDMQEDKEPLFDTFTTVESCLKILIAFLPRVSFNRERMLAATKEGFILATDVADYLVTKGLPFREAHEVTGKLVQFAIQKKCGLEDFDLTEFKTFSDLFEDDVKDMLSVENAVNRRESHGGTARTEVQKQIDLARDFLSGRK